MTARISFPFPAVNVFKKAFFFLDCEIIGYFKRQIYTKCAVKDDITMS